MALDSGYFEVSKPAVTNADRIRERISQDQELANMLVRYDPNTDMFLSDDGHAHYDFESALNAELEWLKQPAEADQ